MKKISVVTAILVLSLGASFAADEDITYRGNSFSFSSFLTRLLPGAAFYPTFLENYAPDATFLIEESNGFSLIDPPRVYYEGDPYNQFNWYYEGFKINSALDDGSPGVLLPFSAAPRFELRGETPIARDQGFHFLSGSWDRSFSRIRFSTAGSGLGGTIPWAKTFVNPHATGAKRNAVLYSERRKILSDYDLDFFYFIKGKSSALSFALTAFDERRQFNDFNALNRTFRERGKGLLLSAAYERRFKEGSLFLTGAYNGISRNHDLAELGRYPQETRPKERQSLFAGLRLKQKLWSVDLSFLRENEDLTPTAPNFLKDLKDNDGEGLFPFEKSGSFTADIYRLNLNAILLSSENGRKTGIDLFSEAKLTVLDGKERAADFNPLSFDKTPELVILWSQGQPYRNTNLEFKAGALLSLKLGTRAALNAKILLQHSQARFQDGMNNLSFTVPGFDLGLVLFKNPEILISYEQMPYELRENVNFFLETRRPWGTIYHWNDLNGDLLYQAGEEGSVSGYTGGRFHSPAADLKIPIKRRILASLTATLSKAFSLSLKGLFKMIDDNTWVRFKEDYGFYEEVDSVNLFFYDAPYRDYVLANDTFSKKPFYAQFLFQINSRENMTWFFSFSFLAHIGMGRTAFGNGAGANDIGILSESQADPNTLINAFGRLDGDRAFLGKIFFGFFVAKDLSLGVDLKYRDGTPFAFIQTVRRYDQRVFYYKTIKAENELGIKGGPRKDFLSDVSVQLRYEFRLFRWQVEADLSVFNLLDFGSELSESVFSGGWRYANELQIPRSFRFGLAVEF
ncbi:MAG: hypothetical protein Q8O91_10380 [Candidatus Aminicenantes bacterium]|nr:hypothetical protein [Candidatus Aminicenantes bacterium]